MHWLTQFFGRFHPLLVHLPIGILFLAFLFECLSQFKAYRNLRSAVQPALFWGGLFAIASVISGFFLSQEGGYEDRLLTLHQYMGIATVAAAVVLYIVRLKSARYVQHKARRNQVHLLLFLPLIALLSFTGHLGGSMTHGEEYLFEPLATAEEISDPAVSFKSISNVDEAVLYQDVIEPILHLKCYSCHSSKKRKGALRLDEIAFIEQGGKHGAVIEDVADSSSLYSRLVLPLDDELHMPPNERPQLSSSEIALIKAWIDEGASFQKKVNAFAEATRIKKYITTLTEQSRQEQLIPAEAVPAADAKILDTLRTKGILIIPVADESHYLSVSFVNARSVTDADLQLLMPLKTQLLWLNLGRTTVTNEGLKIIAQLSSLRQLHLGYTSVNDDGLKQLASLAQLRYLNLVGTPITDKGLAHLVALKKLQKIFLYQTQVTAGGIKDLATRVPALKIDTGGYALPALASDTVTFKRKQ